MNPIEEAAAKARQKMSEGNPTIVPGKTVSERKRVPLSVPQRKLEVPDVPGYHLRWIRGTAARLKQAEDAGFLFVDDAEVNLNSVHIGGDAAKTGNSDLGSRVSVIEGSDVENGQAVRLYLMKQPMEYYLEDRKITEDRNDSIADALNGQYDQGAVGGRAAGETNEDMQRRYVDASRSKRPDLFRRKNVR
jgi:hypothetical protein